MHVRVRCTQLFEPWAVMPIRAHVIEGDTRLLIPGQHCALNGDVFARVCLQCPIQMGLDKIKIERGKAGKTARADPSPCECECCQAMET
jgi:hypothetical protein